MIQCWSPVVIFVICKIERGNPRLRDPPEVPEGDAGSDVDPLEAPAPQRREREVDKDLELLQLGGVAAQAKLNERLGCVDLDAEEPLLPPLLSLPSLPSHTKPLASRRWRASSAATACTV